MYSSVFIIHTVMGSEKRGRFAQFDVPKVTGTLKIRNSVLFSTF